MPHDPTMNTSLDAQWRIEARKYDGRLHYTLPAHLVEDDGERLRLHTELGAPLVHVTRGFERPMRHASDAFFWRGRCYNVYADYTPTGELYEFYCNVSLPPVIAGRTVSFVDIDLDVSIRPNGGVFLLDADEFIEHARVFRYPPDVQRQAWLTVLDIIARWRAGKPPFDWLDTHR